MTPALPIKMNFSFPAKLHMPMHMIEQKLRDTARVAPPAVWVALPIITGVMVVGTCFNTLETGSPWMLALALVAFMLSLAARDVLAKVNFRNTEDGIVRDVRAFLERQTTAPTQAADFARVSGRVYCEPSSDLAVFDVMPRPAFIDARPASSFFVVN